MIIGTNIIKIIKKPKALDFEPVSANIQQDIKKGIINLRLWKIYL